ncbi:MAG: Gfo/Idh/MocA family oxidoreductase [Pirellulaceae bacterium]|nr:Gfo/Idh/MocA family oxidoreductase [Pirellulaceae bacterium]
MASDFATSRDVHAAGSDEIRIGLVGCGGRGAGAAFQALTADPQTRLVAVADAFPDRMISSLSALSSKDDISKQVTVDADHQFVGFDGYRHVIESDVDVVLLATPPHFRPIHLRAAVEAGKHVFVEKPVAVDGPGIRSVIESGEMARKKNLCVVSGLNGRFSPQSQEMMQRIHDGAIGEITALHAVRNGDGVWVRPREPGMTEMEYQMRNWYYFTWLSGDFNVEMFIHQYDELAWAMQDEPPISCYGTGGRQVRTGEMYGHIYDHFSTVFEYASGARAFTTTRHFPGCGYVIDAFVMGTKGTAFLGRNPRIIGESAWQPPRTRERDSHQLEQDAFFTALREGRTINNTDYMAKSTMMAILARMSSYTGQTLTWEQGIQSQQDLSPSSYSWDGIPTEAVVAIPGVTKFS